MPSSPVPIIELRQLEETWQKGSPRSVIIPDRCRSVMFDMPGNKPLLGTATSSWAVLAMFCRCLFRELVLSPFCRRFPENQCGGGSCPPLLNLCSLWEPFLKLQKPVRALTPAG